MPPGAGTWSRGAFWAGSLSQGRGVGAVATLALLSVLLAQTQGAQATCLGPGLWFPTFGVSETSKLLFCIGQGPPHPEGWSARRAFLKASAGGGPPHSCHPSCCILKTDQPPPFSRPAVPPVPPVPAVPPVPPFPVCCVAESASFSLWGRPLSFQGLGVAPPRAVGSLEGEVLVCPCGCWEFTFRFGAVCWGRGWRQLLKARRGPGLRAAQPCGRGALQGGIQGQLLTLDLGQGTELLGLRRPYLGEGGGDCI